MFACFTLPRRVPADCIRIAFAGDEETGREVRHVAEGGQIWPTTPYGRPKYLISCLLLPGEMMEFVGYAGEKSEARYRYYKQYFVVVNVGGRPIRIETRRIYDDNGSTSTSEDALSVYDDEDWAGAAYDLV